MAAGVSTAQLAQFARTEAGTEFLLTLGSALAAIYFDKTVSAKARAKDELWALVQAVGGGLVAASLPEQPGIDVLRSLCLGLSVGGASYLLMRA